MQGLAGVNPLHEIIPAVRDITHVMGESHSLLTLSSFTMVLKSWMSMIVATKRPVMILL